MRNQKNTSENHQGHAPLAGVGGSFSTKSLIPALKLSCKGGKLKLDKHPMSGRARIMIESWRLEDDGWGGEEMEHESATFILSLSDCIKLRDQLNERIEKDRFCTIEDERIRCDNQCSDCERIQAGLPD